jgi:hypothetical protein
MWDNLSESQKAAVVYIGLFIAYGILGYFDRLNGCL